MQALLKNPSQRRHLIENSRVVNNLFSFAGIGVNGGGFEHFPAGGTPHVRRNGALVCMYCMRDGAWRRTEANENTRAYDNSYIMMLLLTSGQELIV